jgi:2-C-methyl-D-erythritol 4-phosphate cytidylyltransferase
MSSEKPGNPDVAATTKASAVLLAAGLSTRMASGGQDALRKPFLVIEGLTVVEHACAAFDRVAAVREIVLVGHADDRARLARMAETCATMRKVRRIVSGGELRIDSVRSGLAAVDRACEIVAIHDVARPLIDPATIERAIRCAAERGAALVAIPVADTVKTSSDGVHVESTLDRSVLWSAQTPQVFRRELFEKLLERARAEGFRPTDDSALHERFIGPVAIVPGSPLNLKITTSEDLGLAASILRARQGARKP